MRGRVIAIVCAFAFVLVPAAFAGSARAPATPTTMIMKDFTETLPAVNPCTGANGTVTFTVNGVLHMNALPSGATHFTGTETGTFVLTADDPTLPTYTGHFTEHFSSNFNSNNAVVSSTFSIHGTGTDGSSLQFHGVQHLVFGPSGVKVMFEKLRCG